MYACADDKLDGIKGAIGLSQQVFNSASLFVKVIWLNRLNITLLRPESVDGSQASRRVSSL